MRPGIIRAQEVWVSKCSAGWLCIKSYTLLYVLYNSLQEKVQFRNRADDKCHHCSIQFYLIWTSQNGIKFREKEQKYRDNGRRTLSRITLLNFLRTLKTKQHQHSSYSVFMLCWWLLWAVYLSFHLTSIILLRYGYYYFLVTSEKYELQK